MHGMDISGLDLNLLRVLHVLLEERSVTRAAERLHLSQSAASHALSRLRRYFGDPLLTRTVRGMQPTSRAEAMAPVLARILAEVASMAGTEPFAPEHAEGLVRITALSTAMMVVIPGLVQRLGEIAPRLRLECRQWSAETLDEIESGQVDLAIGTRGQCEREGLRLERLFTERYVCVVRRGHPAASGPLTQAEYESWPHALVDSTNLQTGPVNQLLETLGVRRPGTFTTHHALTAHLVVERTDMILTVTRTIGELYVRSADVVLLEPPLEVGELPLYLAWHPRTTASPLHEWLRGLLHELAGAGAGRSGSPALAG